MTTEARREMRKLLLDLEQHRRKCANGQQVKALSERIDKLKAEIEESEQKDRERGE